MADVKRAPKKLFDPNRSYSSLVGGSKIHKSSMTSEGEVTYVKNNAEVQKEVYSNSLRQSQILIFDHKTTPLPPLQHPL